MRSGNLASGPGFAFIINGGHSLIGGGDYGADSTSAGRQCPDLIQSRSLKPPDAGLIDRKAKQKAQLEPSKPGNMATQNHVKQKHKAAAPFVLPGFCLTDLRLPELWLNFAPLKWGYGSHDFSRQDMDKSRSQGPLFPVTKHSNPRGCFIFDPHPNW